jgi:RNA polymerase sigma-70 factor (ECF subfamily)
MRASAGLHRLAGPSFCASAEHHSAFSGVSRVDCRALRVEWPAMSEGDADAQLMLRYAAGDARAFDELYGNHRNGLWRYIRRSVKDAAATDDVFQECWSRVIAHRESYRPEARFASWLYRVAHNCCMDYWRKSGRREGRETADDEAIAAAPGDDSSEPLPAVLAAEAGARLEAALEQLPAEQRAAFLLYVEGGLSVAEIGEAMGVNPETAKSRLRYAANRLKRSLGGTGTD